MPLLSKLLSNLKVDSSKPPSKPSGSTPARRRAPHLPVEIVYQILRYAIPRSEWRVRVGGPGVSNDRNDALMSYSLISSDWVGCAQRELFRHVDVISERQCIKLAQVVIEGQSGQVRSKGKSNELSQARALERRKELASMVETVRVLRKWASISAGGGATVWSGASLRDILRSLPELREVRLEDVSTFYLQDLVSLRHLHTIVLVATPIFDGSAQLSLPSLRHFGFSLRTSSDRPSTHPPFSLPQLAPNLRSFCAHAGDRYTRIDDELQLVPIDWYSTSSIEMSRRGNTSPATSSTSTSATPVAVLNAKYERFDEGEYGKSRFREPEGFSNCQYVQRVRYDLRFKAAGAEGFKTLVEREWKHLSTICFVIETRYLRQDLRTLVYSLERVFDSNLDEEGNLNDGILPLLKEIRIPWLGKIWGESPKYTPWLVSDLLEGEGGVEELKLAFSRRGRTVKVVMDERLCRDNISGQGLYTDDYILNEWFWSATRNW